MAYSAQNPLDPSQTSSDYNAMEREWQLISAIMAGVVEMRKHAASHLPKFEGEGADEYRRRSHADPWRPEFSDIVQTLASKPFGNVELPRSRRGRDQATALVPAEQSGRCRMQAGAALSQHHLALDLQIYAFRQQSREGCP